MALVELPTEMTRLFGAVLVFCLIPRDAQAYVDPGSGFLLIQGVLAVIGGIIVFIKNPVATCKRLWARWFSRSHSRDK